MEILLISATIFLLAGIVKGMVGFGFPLIALVLLTLFIGLQEALPLTILPSILTNIWQALDGGQLKAIFRRMWLYFGISMLCILLASSLLVLVNVSWLTALLGVVLVSFSISQFVKRELSLPAKLELPVTLLLAPINGFISGTTGVYLVPSLMYMKAIGFRQDMLIQAMGVFFCLSSLMLGLSLNRNNLLSIQSSITSVVALLPAFAGIYCGRMMRKKVDGKKFQLIFNTCLIVMGAYLVVKSIINLTAKGL